MNPYSGTSFITFFTTLFQRVFSFMMGGFEGKNLASDEIQALVLVGVAIPAALLGCFLVLRKMTMLANSLSHTILLGIVMAFVLTPAKTILSSASYIPISVDVMLVASFLTGIVTTCLTGFLTRIVRLQEDAGIGIVFTSMFALGVILVTLLTRNAHIGVEAVMGNVDALHLDDLKLVYLVLIGNILLLLLFFKEYSITSFDAGLASTLGISPLFFNYLLMVQVSATAVGAFRAVGVLLVLAFITGPPLTARLFVKDLKKMLLWSALIGAVASVTGVALSRHLLSAYGLSLSTGGLVVCVITAIFVLAASTKVKFSSIKRGVPLNP